MKKEIQELIEKFNLKNDLTDNKGIWVGHAKIGYRNRPNIEQAKEYLKEIFPEYIEENQPTPEYLVEIMKKWENSHPYQKVRELDQPMFVLKEDNQIYVAVIWPWQIREGVASLMLYVGEMN